MPTTAKKKAPAAPGKAAFRITFSGLCSLTEVPRAAIPQLFALLVAGERSSVARPKLCRHRPYLLFRLDEANASNGDFYSTFVQKGTDGTWAPWGLWDIDGCDIRLELDGIAAKETRPRLEPKDLLDLREARRAIDPFWLGPNAVAERGLLAARFFFDQGRLVGGGATSEQWAMASDAKPKDVTRVVRLTQTADYVLNGQFANIVIAARNTLKDDQRQTLTLRGGSEVLVSNLCSGLEQPAVGTDVLALYDLFSKPPAMKNRRIPRGVKRKNGAYVATSDRVMPKQSACPPVVQ